MAAKTLQQQGVPIRSRLRGPQATQQTRRHVVQRRTPINGEMGGTQTETVTTETRPSTSARRTGRSASVRDFSPVRAADKATSGVGLLEAEFLGALILLIALMFANTSASYADKIMSIMKRGTLVCFFFFLLALISSAGPNAAKLSKALGALVLIAILVTTPAKTMITDVDSLIKNDWVGSTEAGNDVGSADAGTSSSGSNASSGAASGALGAAQGAISRINNIIEAFGGFA